MVLLCAAVPAAAQQTSGSYTVRALGLKVGDFALTGSVSGSKYTVSSQFVTSGLVGAVAGVKFLLSASGNVRGDAFRPSRYDEDMETGSRESRASLRYRNGVARSTGSEVGTAGPFAVTDAQQKGAVDPLTAMFMVMRDQPRDGLCKVRQRIYDGERLTEVALTTRSDDGGGGVTCSGLFRRVGGYSPEDLKRKGQFGLSVTYEPAGDLMRAVKMRADTVHGRATLTRK